MDEIHEASQPNNDGLDQDGLEPADKIIGKAELTGRDIAAFKLAHEHRYLVYNQIRAAFWKERSLPAKACYRRVERLVNSGFLKQGYSGRKGMHVYFLTERSLEILQEQGLDSSMQLYVPTKYFDRSIDHDLKLLNVRILFRGFGLDSWTGERVLRERDHLKDLPDAVLNIRGKRIPIEFENHLTKSMERYQEMLSFYSEHLTYFILLMIIDGDTKDWLVRGLEYNAKRIWFTTYNELIDDKEEALFENKRASFKLARLL